jgi:hypothetical protein
MTGSETKAFDESLQQSVQEWLNACRTRAMGVLCCEREVKTWEGFEIPTPTITDLLFFVGALGLTVAARGLLEAAFESPGEA